MTASRKASWAVAGYLLGLMVTAAHAATPCSEVADPEDASIAILRCGSVVVAAEASAVHSPASSMSSHQGTIQLDNGAIAVSADSPIAQFSVLTPDAVVSGGDGEWLIVAEPGRTRALVWRGTAVSRMRSDGSQKVLRPGDAKPDDVDSSRSERLAQALKRAKAHP
jgi:predicted dehydrogenase